MHFRRLFLLVILLASAVSLGDSKYSIGVSPGIVQLDGIEPDEQKVVKFFVITQSEEPLVLNMEISNGNMDFFSRSGYESYINNYSEQSTDGWLKSTENPVKINPSDNSGLPETIKGWKEISLLLDVPENAEPGYHLINVRPAPSVDKTSPGKVGTILIASVSFSVLFRVNGDASRQGIILDTVAENYRGSTIDLNTFFKNTGTTTMTIRATHKIYNSNGTELGTFLSPKETAAPQQVKKIFTPVRLDMPPDNYTISTKVNFITGETEKRTELKITGQPLAPKEVAAEARVFPITLIILVIIIIVTAYVIYRNYRGD